MKQLCKSITQQITDSAKKNTMAINIYMTFSINQQGSVSKSVSVQAPSDSSDMQI